jgi:hypothetical protein
VRPNTGADRGRVRSQPSCRAASPPPSRPRDRKFYADVAIPSRMVAFATGQPEDVDVNEIVFRPTKQSFEKGRILTAIQRPSMAAFIPSRHFAALRNLVAIGAIADFGQPNALEDLWVHGLISQNELLHATRVELNAMLPRIAAQLPSLPEGSHELRIAHYDLYNIRLALARPGFRLR